VIRAGLTGEDLPKAPRLRGGKHLRSPVPVELAIDLRQSRFVYDVPSSDPRLSRSSDDDDEETRSRSGLARF
jgi:hypothetical protein